MSLNPHIIFVLEKMKNYGANLAVVTGGKKYTYNDLLDEYKKAWLFLEDNNIPDNSIVALRGEFTPGTIGMMLALIGKNCIYVPIATAVKTLDDYIRTAEAQYYIEGATVQIIRKETPSHPILQSLISKKEPGLVLFSSGTTGEPKAAVHNLVPLLEKYHKGGKAFRAVAFLLFDHIGGFNTVMYSLVNGGMLATVSERTPEEIAAFIQKYRLELLPTSPSFINMLLFSHIYEKYDLSSLRIISYGTESMPETTLKAVHQVLPNVHLKQTYGLSEVGIIRTKSEADDSLWLKVGGDEDHQIKVVDGLLYIKSKMSMLGYLNAPSPFDAEGWMNTKDRVEQKDGYIRILGRESELINVGGEKVFPEEVENVLLQVPLVQDAVVAGEKNPILGNVVTCRIAVAEGTDCTALKKMIQKHCLEKLEKFKRPVKIAFEKHTFNSERFKRKR